MHKQMNHKTTIIEVIGHECSQRDRQGYVASVTGGCSQRKPRMKGRVGELGKLTHPSWATFHSFSNACHTGYTTCIKFVLKFSTILQE